MKKEKVEEPRYSQDLGPFPETEVIHHEEKFTFHEENYGTGN
jgi:hypothetical protein